jgi:Reverse transcriptase (RNA-dependent DNA polymerase)/Group II intron, maturase-specific domain
MQLRNDKRQNIQKKLDFPSEAAGEARQAGREETESLPTMHEPENPANTIGLMEEVCERENLLEALRRVKANKGSAGIDGMTVGQLSAYLKEHWLIIREQLLNGTYEPQPVRRVEIEKPDGGGMRKLGIPQGGPLSPLLSNLVLDELDRELERRGHRYVRYADDCNIYVRSERAGQRVMKSITRFIMQKLKLKVNETKSAVARPQERKFLGFSFTDGPEVQRVIAPKALDRFKRRVREITWRAKGVSIETTMAELAPYMRGWRSYFGFCETPEELVRLTRWVRLRLRVALWRQWKTPRRRRAALLELGVRPRLASNTAHSGRGPRYLVQAKALSVGLSNAYFKSLGLPTLYEEC